MTLDKAKELVGLIFGEAYAKDKKIVEFYIDCNDILIAEEQVKAYELGYDIGYKDGLEKSMVDCGKLRLCHRAKTHINNSLCL